MIGLLLLALMMVPLLEMSIAASRTTAGSNQRMILEMRARRHLAEVATTTHDAALAYVGRPFPVVLGNPDDQDGHGKYLRGITESTVLAEQVRGLVLATTTISWRDAATGGQVRFARSRRLFADPAHALKAEPPLGQVRE
jgi:hypothetical protein